MHDVAMGRPAGYNEFARRGYCGLAGALRPEDVQLNEPVAPDPVELRHTEADFRNLATYVLASCLARAGINPHLLRGDIAVEREPIGLVAESIDKGTRDDGALVQAMSIEARVVDPRGGGLISLSGTKFGVGDTVEAALMQAAEQWVNACLPPLRRAVDETNTARPDGFIRHTVEGQEAHQDFLVFNGPIDGSERLLPNLPGAFLENPYRWIAEREEIVLPPGHLHMFDISAFFDPNAGREYVCRLDGRPSAVGAKAMRSFKWPLQYVAHWLKWHTVLRAID